MNNFIIFYYIILFNYIIYILYYLIILYYFIILFNYILFEHNCFSRRADGNKHLNETRVGRVCSFDCVATSDGMFEHRFFRLHASNTQMGDDDELRPVDSVAART